MNTSEYISGAIRTESVNIPAIQGRMTEEFIHQTLIAVKNAIHALRDLDKVKKHAFYGKVVDLPPSGMGADVPYNADIDTLRIIERLDRRAIRLFHATVGIATEAGELLEQIEAHIFQGAPLDEVNVNEEIGDVCWYEALALDETGTNFETVMRTNLQKLKARFPEKFTEHHAINRDLQTERKILEQ